ncbi:hypothetical protein A8926_6708 [Saccharopolyspora spinosa]|uniref:SH3 domain-containing protein n=1 Tax=Saccharopolyspora spinosa TaxID=60894 RepID=A0A2N3Y6W2_SACSN|nr:hypothetical protein A8926_6708 [Saccharopolyspora spinosa]
MMYQRSKLAAVAALTAGLLGGSVSQAHALPVPITGHFTADGVYIHKTPHVNSARLGEGFRNQHVEVHCQTEGDVVQGSNIWFYLTDQTTHVTGYSSSKFVAVSQTPPHC